MGRSRSSAITKTSERASISRRTRTRPKGSSHATETGPSSLLPGVQKLKATLRQTRRLLAKDNLAADVRVATERRLKSLQTDVELAEKAKKERTLAVRYHKVKFFERQKVTRKINQTKKSLAAPDVTKSTRRKLEHTLLEHRVDLNYILHYPKTKKYISLFPADVRHGTSLPETEALTSETDTKRAEVRDWVRGKMEKGELSAEPELHDSSTSNAKQSGAHTRTDQWDEDRGKGDKGSVGFSTASLKAPVGVDEDAFFGEEDGEDEDEDKDEDEEDEDEEDDD